YGERLWVVGRTEDGPRHRAIIARSEHGQDPSGSQAAQVRLELQIATCGGHGPGVVDDVGRVGGRRIAIGIQQPLESEMDTGRGCYSAVVEDLYRDPLGI